MISNKEMLKYCLKNLSDVNDLGFDCDKEYVVIPRVPGEENDTTITAKKLIDLFTEMATLNSDGDFSKDEQIALKINKLFLKGENMNYFPFNQYIQTYGCNYDLYKKLSLEKQLTLMKYYIRDRHFMYMNYGYSNAILQAICDSYAHKRHGDTGTKKMRIQIENQGISHFDFKEDNYYLNPDKGDKNKFIDIIKKLNINYDYYLEKNAKLPDLFVKIGKNYIFVEHKNMKQSGGHQNNVIVEIKDFIKEEDENVYYVSYLDGVAFQKFFSDDYDPNGSGKFDVTNKNFNDIFETHERSYIVNSAGFDKLIEELKNMV